MFWWIFVLELVSWCLPNPRSGHCYRSHNTKTEIWKGLLFPVLYHHRLRQKPHHKLSFIHIFTVCIEVLLFCFLNCTSVTDRLLMMASFGKASMWSKLLAVLALGLAVIVSLSYLEDNKLDTLRGKRVLVTGASTGIGEQLAYHYARLGAHLVITARRKDVLSKVRDRCQEISPNNQSHHVIEADMSRLNETKSVIERATSALGGLDILVLNHIASQRIAPFSGSAENLTMFDTVTDVNYRSYVYLTSFAIPEIIANKGSIVVINSLLGRVPHPFIATYSGTKHALHGFFESLRMQFHQLSQDVSVTLCTLGYIGTENAIEQMEKSDYVHLKIKPASPSDTALAIVQSGARRQNELYYPFWATRSVTLLRSIFPQTAEDILNKFMV